MEEEKLVTLGLAYGDILNYKQTLCQNTKRRSNVNRTDELRRKIRRVPSCKSNAVNKTIYVQKVYTENLGIRYMEATI